MNKLFTKNKIRRIAVLLLLCWALNLFMPLSVLALTSGPAQPESQSFQPVGVSDMVDVFSGDFKYNIPLMDIDGYPINLNYQSGVSMDDEASWVGLGWNLNVGAINRQLRGIPDDFAGDEIQTEHYTKPKVTVGGKITAKGELRGNLFKNMGGGFNGSFTFGVFSDNYTGIGAEIGANAGMSFSLVNDQLLTGGMGIGISSNTASGVDISPNVSLSVSDNGKAKYLLNAGLSASLGYNSRSGLKTLSLGKSFKSYNTSSPLVSYNTEPIMPKVQVPYKSEYDSFSFDFGPATFGLYLGGGGTGYKTVRSVRYPLLKNPGYGFLYAELGKSKPNALMDFIREKENPIIPELPNLAIPVHTPDVFTYNTQNGSGQFRLYRGGTGGFFDNETTDESKVLTAGFDIGGGLYFHGGVTFFQQSTKSTGRKWSADNRYLQNGDFQNEDLLNPRRQHVFFRKSDEKNMEDDTLSNKLLTNSLLRVSTSGKTANTSFVNQTNAGSNISPVSSRIEKNIRQIQTTAISYLTGSEAVLGGLDKTIKTYAFNQEGNFQPQTGNLLGNPTTQSRTDSLRKKHHISEVIVNNPDGQRSVFGMPVYNLKHEEYAFATGNSYQTQDGLVSLGNGGIVRNKGIDHYFHKDSQAPYAYSYLLTGMLSPDYIDKTGDGITADDNGTAIKFNYSKISRYGWRTPYQYQFNGIAQNAAALNRGMLADPDDDKASIVYGEKEVCYVHSIESKTKIAYFITIDRSDALGVQDLNGTPDQTNRQKCLKEIRLYSKADLSKPIKVVKLNYTYELCPGIPNTTSPGQGKLTLASVWFEYGLTHKGANHPYVFHYNSTQNNTNPAYQNLMNDRWGSYKSPSNNPGTLTNEEYPYSEQNKKQADLNAAMWLIQSIDLPSGGKIEVNYEADDYAFVQNKRAMEMVKFDMLGSTNLIGASGIRIKIDERPSTGENVTSWFKRNYLNESDYIYTKSYVKVSTPNAPSNGKDYDFVPVYCKVTGVQIRNDSALVSFERINEANVVVNPIRSAAWQRIKNEYPRYAYPGFQNRIGDNTGTKASAVISAIVSAAGNLAELKQNFYQKANNRGYAKDIDLSKSFAKITKRSGFKTGGGTRVRKISINDNWKDFTGNDLPQGKFGQSYDYTTVVDGKRISSGVATYEPAVGNDENPLKQPVPYIQKIKGAINNYFELEAPFAESFYPSPSVGYSKVSVRDLLSNGAETEFPKTGYVSNEFYTAKDFPVRVRVSEMSRYNPKPSNYYSLIRTQSVEEMILSQGYSIELNDMHGKPKANRIFNQAGAEISATEYHYQVENPAASELKLNNQVQVVSLDGTVQPKIVGRDIEFFTDFREQETSNIGRTINIGLDVFPIAIFPVPIPHIPTGDNNEYKLFRSACAMKVITTSGIISRVVKRENGSSIDIENIAYDGITGEPLITRTQNEFKKDYFTVNTPAYWAYRKMGGAYQNQGVILRNVNLNSFFEINQNYWDLLTQGDELINMGSGLRYWVVDNRREIPGAVLEPEPSKILIDSTGRRLSSITGGALYHQFKVIRSGFRNQISAGIQSLTCMNNPIRNNKLSLADEVALGNLKVISASSTRFEDEWPVDGSGQQSGTFENTSRVFTFKNGPPNGVYGSQGVRLYNLCDGENSSDYCGEPYYFFNSPVLNTRLNASGVWVNESVANNLLEPLGFKSNFFAPESKVYYFGYAADDIATVKVDGISLVDGENGYEYWQLYPVYLTQGSHEIEFQGYNYMLDDNSDVNNPANMGLEIYGNSLQSLIAASNLSDLQILFSSRSAIQNPELQSFRTINGIKTWRYGNENFFNPFLNGVKGNWRVAAQNVYQENRQYDNIFAAGKKGINIASSGFLKTFMSYYIKKSSWEWGINLQSSSWVATNRVTQYDKFGQEAENKDALNRYSAASFDFAGQMPSAVASNAMRREIFVNSFEDALRLNALPDTNATKEFVTGNGNPLISSRTNVVAHTGNYSLLLPAAGIQIRTIKHLKEHKTSDYLGRTSRNEFTLMPDIGLYPRGFEPKTGGQYILSLWVKDGQPLNRNVNIIARMNDNPISLTCKAVVEGWKLLEGTINIPSNADANFKLSIDTSLPGNLYLDDLRIHPYDAHLKSYAYDQRNYRLMAELDENAFATFYEYDDEGSLVRVKKETERGIVTLKENRSSYRRGLVINP